MQFIHATDEKWRGNCPRLVEIVSAAADPDKAGVGSSPWLGDISSTALPIPTASLAQDHRYLFRLCGIQIPKNGGVVIRGLRQILTIRNEFSTTPTQEVPAAAVTVWEKEVTSPLWCFSDGNVSWHLRWQPNLFSRYQVADATQASGTSPSTMGLDSALLYTPPNIAYNPLGAGIPPGAEVAHLGTWRDMRYVWGNTDWTLQVPVEGPGTLVFYASVQQTDPTKRVPVPALTPPSPFTDPVLCGMRPEDQFVLQFPNAIYGHVGGSLLLELMPCCGEKKKHKKHHGRCD